MLTGECGHSSHGVGGGQISGAYRLRTGGAGSCAKSSVFSEEKPHCFALSFSAFGPKADLAGHHNTCEDQFGECGGHHHHQLGGLGSRKSKQGIKSELFATSGGRRMRRPRYFATQDRPPNRPNRLRPANREEYAAGGWWLAAPARWRWRGPL